MKDDSLQQPTSQETSVGSSWDQSVASRDWFLQKHEPELNTAFDPSWSDDEA